MMVRYEQLRSPAPNNKQELDEAPLSLSSQNKVLELVECLQKRSNRKQGIRAAQLGA